MENLKAEILYVNGEYVLFGIVDWFAMGLRKKKIIDWMVGSSQHKIKESILFNLCCKLKLLSNELRYLAKMLSSWKLHSQIIKIS